MLLQKRILHHKNTDKHPKPAQTKKGHITAKKKHIKHCTNMWKQTQTSQHNSLQATANIHGQNAHHHLSKHTQVHIYNNYTNLSIYLVHRLYIYEVLLHNWPENFVFLACIYHLAVLILQYCHWLLITIQL